MGVEIEDPMIANGIVRSQRNEMYEFVCSVCTDTKSFEDWKKHIGNEVHVRTLEQFNLTFEKNGKQIHCKICGMNIDRNELKAHGKSHLIVPWYEPEDKYRTFFENRIIGGKTQLYCCLCEKNFLEWSTAFLHIKDRTHQNLHEEFLTPLTDEFSSKLPAALTFESLVTNGLVFFDEKTVQCQMCENRNIVELTKIVRHVKSFLHLWHKLTFLGKLKGQASPKTVAKHHKNCLITESTSKQFVDTKTNEDQSRKNSRYRYLKKLDAANFRCNVCDCLVFAATLNTNVHVAGEYHADSLKKYGCHNITLKEADTYHCKCCKRDISGLEKLNLHIKNKYHSYALKVNEIFMKFDNRVEEPISKLTVSASPTKKSPRVSGANNASSPEKNGCDKISRKSDNVFHCQCCDRYITGLETVHTHLKEENHKNTLAVSKKQSLPVIDKNPIKVEVPKPPVPHVTRNLRRPRPRCYIRRPRRRKRLEPLYPNIVSQTIPSNYIKAANSTDSRCMICNLELSTVAEVENHTAGSGHKIAMKRYGCDNITLIAGNLYYCRCCNCRIFGHDNVYLHVKGRQHAKERTGRISEKKSVQSSVRPVPSKVALSSILTDDVVKMVEEVKSREAARAWRPYRNRVRFPNPHKFAIENRIRCSVCNIIFDNSAELHSHSASHFSGDFVCCSGKKNSDGPINDTTSKIQMETPNALHSNQNSIESSEKTWIPNTSEKNMEKCGSSGFNGKSCKVPLTNGSSFGSIEETITSERRTPRKKIIRRIVQLANFDKDYIYDMEDKLREIELGMNLCVVTDSTSIYCLVCRKTVENTLQNYFEHLRSLDHCNYLEEIAKDNELFDHFPEQFSELALAYEYMEEISDEALRCLVCHEEVANVDDKIRDHIEEDDHERIRDEMHINARKNFEDVKSRMHCNWYNVHNYWCVLCSENFQSEIIFLNHLSSARHSSIVTQSENFGKALIYDFCAPCALLWYGYTCTHAYHCTVTSHKWLVQDGHYELHELPKSAKDLLATAAKYVEDTIENLESVATTEREKEQTLSQDLKKAVAQRFCNAKVYTYGSRVFGSGGPNSDIHLFLDCGGMYKGNTKSKDRVSSLASSVHQCLSSDPESWDLNELPTSCRTPIVRAHHRLTGLSCDISFENGLSVENTNLIKSFTDVFPPCRRMMLLLKKWLGYCELSGPGRISSYALYWLIIFYLQKETILPSIATLISMSSRSNEIAGWEVGVTREYSYNKAESNFTVEEMLVRFFIFYADFDFRHDVVCPLLGDAVKKLYFADERSLPKGMRSYVRRMKNLADSEPLRADSPMCIQDPLNLQHNITESVSKVLLGRFRICCSRSISVLQCSS